jgi:8-oxo-dGTP pyrophosphatase MutT (NUDIX family)
LSLADELRRTLDLSRERDCILLESDFRDDLVGEAPSAHAAVLIPVVDRREPAVLLTTRTQSLKRHAGQVAFPGGRIDPADEDAIAAALREAEEEIDLKPHHVDVIGMTDEYRTIAGFHVTPVLGVIPPGLDLSPHDAEVADIFEVPLAFLIEPGNHVEQSVEFQGRDRKYVEMHYQGRRIWGATAAMIVNLGRRLATGR